MQINYNSLHFETCTASNGSAKGIFILQVKAEPKIEHLASELYKWFTAMHSEGKHITGVMIIVIPTSFVIG